MVEVLYVFTVTSLNNTKPHPQSAEDLISRGVIMTPAVNAVRKVILISGIPGSGKSTRATYLIKRFIAKFHQPAAGNRTSTYCFATDDFWELTGPYKLEPSKWAEAHGWNQRRFVETLQKYSSSGNGENVLICIPNTFTENISIAPYVEYARAYGFDVHIERMVCSIELALSRQTHNVPETQVRKMARFMEGIHVFWKKIYSEVDVANFKPFG
jgi:hypothetical protein